MLCLFGLVSYGQDKTYYSAEDLADAYEIINIKYPEGLLRDTTIGTANEFNRTFLSYAWLNENNRELIPGGVLMVVPYVDFDTLLTKKQKDELTLKFESVSEFALKQDKINAKTISKLDIKKRIDAEDRICYGVVSFPIIQEGKDGIMYGIIYEMSRICPVSDPGSNMHVYRKIKGKWEYFSIVNVSV
ncbi:hypothetical protein [Anditalea andensis]|uniref:hypothetical protein n=1 Tax=Anditalea andensis TaxID=1048983 RepID=UPI001969BC58|nr:hypothetical protein [Anditalea andensis]